MKIFSRPACIIIVVCVCCAGPLLAACGGSPGGPSPSASRVSPSAFVASPTSVPTPQITSGRPPAGAVAVVQQYWALLSEREYDAAFALTSGSHTYDPGSNPREVESAHYLRPASKVFPTPGDDATVEFGSWIRIVPAAEGSPFGTATRRWLMFSRVVRMSDGSWRLVELGTGP